MNRLIEVERHAFWCNYCPWGCDSLADLIEHHEAEHATRFISIEREQLKQKIEEFKRIGRGVVALAQAIRRDVETIQGGRMT